MNGAEAILQTLIGGGIEVCFANPGTSEMHFVSALDRIENIRCVLGLAETVVTGAADAYARIAGKPAVTLLHLGPGLANGLSNLHNARRGPVPMINIVGDHATHHAKHDAPLASDIMSLAKSMSHWVRRMEVLTEAGADTAAAIAASHEGAGRIATLILPADIAWSDGPVQVPAFALESNIRSVESASMNAAVDALNSGSPTLILLGGNLSRARLQKAAAIAAKQGARLARELFPTLLAHGEGIPAIEHMPYPPQLMQAFFAGVRHVVLIGAATPTTFFAYPGVNSSPLPGDCQLHVLAGHDESIDAALDELLEKTDAGGTPFKQNPPAMVGEYAGQTLDAATIAMILADKIPANSIVVDESVSSAPPLMPALQGAAEHEWIFATGGSIGWGIPASVGAAIAAPERKVICLEGDGSSMYSFQGLWTLAREKLDVVVVIYANRDYSILKTEFDRVGAQAMGERAYAMMNIAKPTIDFVGLAHSLGVPAARADSADEFATLLQRAIATKGPSLIEAVIAGATGASGARQHNG